MKMQMGFMLGLILMGIVLLSGCSLQRESISTREKIEIIETLDNLSASEIGVRYDNRIFLELKEQKFVSVAITLESRDINTQKNILLSLSEDEFILVSESKTGRGFTGKISKEGFEKLLTNQKILSILPERDGHITN